ncbi:putative trans-sialidase [Trypanosoma cruzi]|nr:putative trans-sialidase [Trypanosoma cruzi]
MLSRVAAVKAPRTHNRRRVTGSSGRRREGRESEPQRPNMSRRVFASAVLLLLVVTMCCGTGGAAQVAEVEQSSDPKFEWKDITDDDVTVDSLGAPGLLKVGSDVFAVAEAQCKKDEDNSVFTGIASRFLTEAADNLPKEVLEDGKKYTKVLEEVTSGKAKKKVDVSRPTAVVKGSNIYMLVGKHNRNAAGVQDSGEEDSGLFLLNGVVIAEGGSKKIDWNDTKRLARNTFDEQIKSLTGLIGGGGSGVETKDGDTLLFPVEATKNVKDGKTRTVSLIMFLKETAGWTLSKEISADGCSDPSVAEWEDKLMMMTACDGRRRVYESGDEGESWTEALGTLSRVWGNKQKGEGEKGVGSGFSTAKIDKRDVMLVTLPVYSKNGEKDNPKGVLHLWLTDNTHIVDIGPVSGEDDAAASSLLYKSVENGDQGNKEELIALYEKKKGESSSGMVSVLLTEQLKRVREVLTTWKEVDERVSKLCPSENALEDTSTDTACSTTGTITDGLVGFLSGNFSNDTWKDEYLGVNATVTNGAEKTDNGVTFKGRGAWAEWPVGKQGENQLYHFANHKFTLVATVSFHGEPKEGVTPIPLMGAKMNDNENPVLLGLSYNNKEKKWILLCDGRENKKYSSDWETKTSEHVVVLLRNGNQSSAYVDGQPVGGDEECVLKIADSKEISHFYIGGDGGRAEGQEGVSVTVRNVLLYNRPLSSAEITALAKNKITIPKPEGPTTLVDTQSPATSAPDVQLALPRPNSAGQLPLEEEPLKANIGAGAGGVSSAASVTTSSADANTPASNGEGKVEPAVKKEMSVNSGEDWETAEGTDGQKEGVHSQVREVNAAALNGSLGNLSQGNNSDGGTMRGSGLLSFLLLLLGLWGFAAL